MKIIHTLILVILISTLFACATPIKQHPVPSGKPKVIYLDDQIHQIWPKIEVLKAESAFLEIRNLNGKRFTGKFNRISGGNLELISGYFTKNENDSLIIVNNVVAIPQNQIVIMKIW